jgi:hypothetical protein
MLQMGQVAVAPIRVKSSKVALSAELQRFAAFRERDATVGLLRWLCTRVANRYFLPESLHVNCTHGPLASTVTDAPAPEEEKIPQRFSVHDVVPTVT